MISCPSPASISSAHLLHPLSSPRSYLTLLPFLSFCFITPPPLPPSLLLLPAMSYLHLSPPITVSPTRLLAPISDFGKSSSVQVRCLALLQKPPLCSRLQCDFVTAENVCSLEHLSGYVFSCLSLCFSLSFNMRLILKNIRREHKISITLKLQYVTFIKNMFFFPHFY